MKTLVKTKVNEISKLQLEKEETVSKLLTEKKVLEQRNQGMEEQNQALILRHQGLLESLTFRCATLESKVMDLERKNHQLKSNLKGLADIRVSLEQEKVDDMIKIEELRMDRDDVQKKLDALHLESEALKEMLHQKEESAANADARIQQLQTELASKDDVIKNTAQSLTQRQTEFEEEKVRLEFDNQTLREILQQKDESAGDAGAEIQELRAQLEVQRQNENRLKGIIEDLRPMLKELGINSNNMENDKHLKSVMGIMKGQIKNFKGRNQDLEGENIRLRNKLNYQEKRSPRKEESGEVKEQI